MPTSPKLKKLLGRVYACARDGPGESLTAEEYGTRRRDFVFHMTDWQEDLEKLTQLFANPDHYDQDAACTFITGTIINSSTLRCQGCWVDRAAKQEPIKPEAFHKLVREAKEMGNVFFGIVGGEPFMHPHLLDMLAEHPDCYFQIFTNGQFITEERAKRLRQLGNVTPLISVEGNEIVSDERHGRANVFSNTMTRRHN